jgi:hypothetical protein
VNGPVLGPQRFATELFEDEPSENEDEEGVEAKVSVEIAANARPLQPQETGDHRMFEKMAVLSGKENQLKGPSHEI